MCDAILMGLIMCYFTKNDNDVRMDIETSVEMNHTLLSIQKLCDVHKYKDLYRLNTV